MGSIDLDALRKRRAELAKEREREHTAYHEYEANYKKREIGYAFVLGELDSMIKQIEHDDEQLAALEQQASAPAIDLSALAEVNDSQSDKGDDDAPKNDQYTAAAAAAVPPRREKRARS